MSDQIKTQHGTIGLLMAECEQLRRDLAQAEAENARLAAALKAWQISARTFEEMLAPTIELLESWVRWRNYGSQDNLVSETTHELARLRAITKQ